MNIKFLPFLKSSTNDMFIDFRERGRGQRERNSDVRENHLLIASCMRPDKGSKGLNLQPRYVP